MRPRFFVDSVEREVALSAADAHHARRVLRARPGDLCELVVESTGALLRGAFVQVGDAVVVRVDEVCPAPTVPRPGVALLQALPDPRKVDEIVEKGTEVGVDLFLIAPVSASPPVPVDRLIERATRWRRIAREAAKQSRRLTIPVVDVAATLSAAGEYLKEGDWKSLVLDPAVGRPLKAVLGQVSRRGSPARVALWVGPESGWSDEERAWFEQEGLPVATLGQEVLRTETAGPVAAAVCRFALGDWEYTHA